MRRFAIAATATTSAVVAAALTATTPILGAIGFMF